MTSHEDSNFKLHITNVFALKRMIDEVVEEIKTGEYNPTIIKRISNAAEDIFNSEFDPKAVEVDNDTESESDIDMDMDDENDGPKFVEDEGDLDAEFEKLQKLLNRRRCESPDMPITKKVDKLAEEFLNNNINYSKNIRTKCDFYKSCFSY